MTAAVKIKAARIAFMASESDKEAWLQLAADWLQLAEDAEK
jgi:hypothetical protein